MPINLKCDKCGKRVEKGTQLKIVKKIKYCSECYKELKRDHRKETIEQAGIEQELKDLGNKIKRESGRKQYRKKNGIPLDAPVAKGARSLKRKIITNSYMTIQEKQSLFRILIKRGLSYEEADERVKALVEYEKELREKIVDETKLKEKLSKEKEQMLQELWNF